MAVTTNLPFQLNVCPSTLSEGFSTYSPSALRNVFYGKKVSHLLDFDAPEMNEDVAEMFRQNSKSISVSGAQFKQSLILEKNILRLTTPGEQGQYILKPVPFRPPFGKAEELPANEHLTMQLAKQVFGIQTAECGLVFFRNGQAAYITRRFDITNNGGKIAQEDFASLSGKSKAGNGDSYRNLGSYLDVAFLLKNYVSAYPVEIEKLFNRVVFNYIFSNGDAHLKNFSLQQTANGDYILSPAYDMFNTAIHISNDSFFALYDGLFLNDYESESFQKLGFYAYDDFYDFGIKAGMVESRIKKILFSYTNPNPKVSAMAIRSFLSPTIRDLYLKQYKERVLMLGRSFRQIL